MIVGRAVCCPGLRGGEEAGSGRFEGICGCSDGWD